MANILFDLDGTIAKTTQYHKVGWDCTLRWIGLSGKLEEYLPYEKGLLERYDSYRRLKNGFLKSSDDRAILSTYFDETKGELIVRKLLDLKESFTIKAILSGTPVSVDDAMAPSLDVVIESLNNSGYTLGVLSSSRRGIVSAYLRKSGLRKYFSYILGEEDMTDNNGILFDKPDPYGEAVIRKKIGSSPTIYIGDSLDIDPLFAKNIGAKFIHYKYDMDSNLILSEIC